MKKILFIINSLKSLSGSERVACILANELAETPNYKITLINRDVDFNNTAYELHSSIHVEKISGSLFQFYQGLKSFILNKAPDIVIVHNMGKLSLLCAFIPQIKKLVSLEHVSFISRPKVVQLLSKLLYKKIDQVVTLTSIDKSFFSDFHDNVLIIPNFSPFPISNTINRSQKQIVAIGRLTDQKNYIHLLKAWKKIFNQLPEWQLSIFGDGEHETLLNEYIQSNAIGNVYLKGATSDIRSVYEASSFFVMSSKYEGLPMVLIEAQSFGLPIVSYDCPNGPSDIIKDKVNGYLVEDQNIDQLADRILLLASSPLDLVKFSQNSLKNAENYQPEKILHLWSEQIFKG
ncbi:glycosyltransferase family 4 protein [Acinetobacter sp. YH01020]|uniref:glycosyltransferase family 4 protein n=1 Tax=Acinetobacter sp. YH01020 TaxID=2601034 RepID=UPI0015D31020|nr:glycosyltransferase family 4 protein [Acinetobacter sp. YH01020]